MGMFNVNILPASTGLSLGSTVQQWKINGLIPAQIVVTATAFSSSPGFTSSSPLPVFTITLTGNVTSSAMSLSGVAQAIVIFQITQDGTGGRTFTWPPNFIQPSVIGLSANQVTTQIFYFDGTNAWPLGPGMSTP